MLTIKGIDTSNKFEFLEKYDRDISVLDCIMSTGMVKAVGIGATILNGYSYLNPLGNMIFAIPNDVLDGFETVFFKMIYLEGYDMQTGYEEYPSVGSPVRNICDYFMYPKELNADMYIMDAIEGYYEDTNGELTGLREMMKYFNIDSSLLDERLKYLYHGSNRHYEYYENDDCY